MELDFEMKKVRCLRAVADRVVSQEETGEAIVPDSCPDVARTAGCFGTVVLRSKDCREGSVVLSGGIHAFALIVPEDGSQVRAVPVYLPFTQRVDVPGATGGSRVVYTPRLRALDARLINSRKVLVRADLSARVEVYEPEELTVSAPVDCPPEVQLHRVTMPVTLTDQMTEKSFQLSEDLELPGGVPACEALLKWSCALRVAEQRVVGERVVFRGSAEVRVLCRAPEGTLFRHEFSVPFSQFADLDREGGEEAPRVVLVCTGAELTPDGQEPTRRFLLTLDLLAQCVTQTRTELEFVDDLYATHGEAKLQTELIGGTGMLDVQQMHESVCASVPGECREVLDATVLFAWPEVRREGEQVRVDAGANVTLLTLDENGQLQCASAQVQAQCATTLAQHCDATADCAPGGEVYCVPGGEGAEARFGVDITITSAASCQALMVTGAELHENADEPERPSVIVRAVEDGQTLWSIAKACRTSVSAVQSANALDDDPPEGTLLLIPRA